MGSADAAMEVLLGYVPDDQKVDVLCITKVEVRKRSNGLLMCQLRGGYGWDEIGQSNWELPAPSTDYLHRSIDRCLSQSLPDGWKIADLCYAQTVADEHKHKSTMAVYFALVRNEGRQKLECAGKIWIEYSTKLLDDLEPPPPSPTMYRTTPGGLMRIP